MTYFKICDTFHSHPKRHRAGNEAVGLWASAGSWCGQQLSDGRVEQYVVDLYGNDELAQRLCEAKLWHAPGHDCPSGCPQITEGYVFHEWTKHNRTRDEVERERAKWRLKKAGQRMSPGDSPRESLGDSTGYAPWDSPWESRESPGIGTGDLAEEEKRSCVHGEPRGEWACAICRKAQAS